MIARHPYRMQGLAIINVQKSCYFFLEITVFFCFLLAEKSVQYVFYDFGLSPSGPVRAIKDISLHGRQLEIQEALEYVQKQNLKVEVIGYSAWC